MYHAKNEREGLRPPRIHAPRTRTYFAGKYGYLRLSIMHTPPVMRPNGNKVGAIGLSLST